MVFNGFIVVVTLFISTIYRNLILSNKKAKEAIQLKSQVLEAESRMLKSQINPHFLFNTLNNIYALSQAKSDKTGDAVHRLSEMLRYVIYDCNEQYVTLGQETDYIAGYIELQMLKDHKISNIKFDHQDTDRTLKIAPLLLIAFLENSFKHSNFEDTEKGYIDIRIRTKNGEMEFFVENSTPDTTQTKDKSGGIGLENVKRRLDLLYTGRYRLGITSDEQRYSVQLNILL
jgi:LytS/YehU family sensor histidine kinase